MTCDVLIVGLPSAATCPPEKTWRSAAGFVVQRLHARFGDEVVVEYVDLFSPGMADHGDVEARIATEGLMPPIVVVNGTVMPAAGKLNVSAIERAVAAVLEGVAVVPPEAVAHG
jgi:hypothetical protein